MFFLPYKIETLFKHWPWANWLIMAVTIVTFFLSQNWSAETLYSLVLCGTSPLGLVTHLFLHISFVHLAGNLLFLWVFGNAVCGMTSNWAYPLLYLTFGVLAAAVHVAFAGNLALGASGAINGVVGMAFAMFPQNGVSVFWFFFVRGGTIELPLWTLALCWVAVDAFGAFFGTADVAYWAHLGGFAVGALAGFIALKLGWVTLTEYDNASLADLILRRKPQKPKPASDKWAWEEPMNLND